MTGKQKRGWPKHWINDLPRHVKILGTPDQVTVQILKNAEQLERLLRKGEPRGVPTHLLAELNDFDDLTPERKRTVLVDYRKQKFKIDNARQDGATAMHGTCYQRQDKVPHSWRQVNGSPNCTRPSALRRSPNHTWKRNEKTKTTQKREIGRVVIP